LFVASLLALFYLANFGWITRLPLGHDVLQYLQLQYSFLNEAVMRREFAHWFPYMTMGTVSNWWFMISDALLNNLYLLISPLLKGGNYYALFYVSLFFDEMVLLVGAVCLGRMLYSHGLSVLFIAVSIVFSVNWAFQVWWGFHVLYLAPLTMFLFMDAWRNLRPLSAFAGCMCVVYAFYGNLFYILPAFVWIVALPAGFRALVCLKPSFWRIGGATDALRRLAALAGGWRWLAYGIPLLCIVLIGLYLTQLGTGEIALGRSGRSADGKVSLDIFLSFGGAIYYQKLSEFITGIPFAFDITLYLGGVAATLALFEAWCVIAERRLLSASAVFLMSAAVVYLLSSGNYVVGNFFYHLPGMPYFRHVGLIAGFAQLYFFLAAGYGCDRLLAAGSDRVLRRRLAWMAAAVVAIKVFLGPTAVDCTTGIHIGLDDFQNLFVNPFCNLSPDTLSRWWTPLLATTIVPAIWLLLRAIGSATWGSRSVTILIALQFLDLVVFRAVCLNGRMPANDASAHHLMSCLAFEDYQYQPRRLPDVRSAPRLAAIAPRWFTDDGWLYAHMNDFGMVYWNTETFLLTDAARCMFRCDHRLKYLDRLALLRNHRIDGNSAIPFPVERFQKDSVYEKLIGVGEDKIQFFQTVRKATSEADADKVLGDKQFAGDMLVGLAEQHGPPTASGATTPWTALSPGTNANDRVSATCSVDKFSFSLVDLSVQNPRGSPIALYYADAYHPYWRAYVDGQQVPIIRANHAFKAILVPPGTSHVSFVYGTLVLRAVVLTIIIIGLSGVVMIACLVGLLLRGDIDRLPRGVGALADPRAESS
jgi:hypothetical protein